MTNEPNPQAPSVALMEACSRRLMALDPALTRDVAILRASHLARERAILLDASGEVGIKPTGVDLVRRVAPALLGERPAEPKIDARTREGRALQREQIYEQRIASAQAPKPKRVDFGGVNKAMGEAIAADPSLTKSPARRAALREELTRKAYADAGARVPNSLDANGVR